MLDHYLALGGNEIVNSERAYGYATTSDCPVDWLEDPECDTIAEVQGDEQYEYANIEAAPWYDPDDPETTSRFLGLYGIDIRNLSDSTRTATVTEKTTAGAVVSGYRHASREVRVRGWMTAQGDDALEAGMTWLRNALEPNACGMHGGNCGESDSAFFVSCPPERRLERLYTPWEVRATNLATNPSFETTSGTVEVRRNRILNPALRTDTTGYSFSGAGQVVTRAIITDLPGFTRAYHSALTDPPAGARIMYQMTGLTVGAVYTISLWVKNSNSASVATSSDNNAANFVVISAPAVRQSWTRVTGTFTAAAASHYLQVRQDGAGVGASEQMMTGLLLELGDTGAMPYFDGSVQPRLRENRMLNPTPTSVGTTTQPWLNAGGGSSTIVVGAHGQSAIRQERISSGTAVALYGQRNQADMPRITPGETWTLSMTIRAKSNGMGGSGITMGLVAAAGTSYLADSSVILNLTTEEQRYSVTYTVPAGSPSTGMILSPRVGWVTAAGVTGDWLEISEVLLEKTSQVRPFFDGDTADVSSDGFAWSGAVDASSSYQYDLDLTPAWGGTADASLSRLNGVGIQGAAALSSLAVAAVSTQTWAASGSRSVRLISQDTAPSANSAALLQFVSATPGEVYTAKVKVRLDRQQTGALDPSARTVRLLMGSTYYTSTPAPNEPGVHEVTVTGVVPAAAALVYVLVTSGGVRGSGDIWVDDLVLVKEAYSGSYFDGTLPPVLDEFGEEIERFAWTGAANASTSTHETRSSFEAPEGDDTYLPYVDQYRRFLHSVRCISGPFTIAERESIDGRFLGRLVEFTLLAEVPWVFGVPKEIEIPPLTPTVMQDIAFNLLETPSMELATGSMVVATNYVTNPSLEVDVSQWAGAVATNSGSAPGTYFTSGRVTGELAAAGVASMRGRILGNGSTAASGQARILLTMTQDITGIDPDSRPSFLIWAAGVSVGGATGAQIVSIRASVEIGTGDPTPDLILDMGTVTDPALISGHVFTAPSTELPAGVTEAVIYVIATVNWSSSATPASNSDIRIYADAAAITVP